MKTKRKGAEQKVSRGELLVQLCESRSQTEEVLAVAARLIEQEMRRVVGDCCAGDLIGVLERSLHPCHPVLTRLRKLYDQRERQGERLYADAADALHLGSLHKPTREPLLDPSPMWEVRLREVENAVIDLGRLMMHGRPTGPWPAADARLDEATPALRDFLENVNRRRPVTRKRVPCSAQLHDRSLCGDRAVGMMVMRDIRFRHEYPRCGAHLASAGTYDILPFSDDTASPPEAHQ